MKLWLQWQILVRLILKFTSEEIHFWFSFRSNSSWDISVGILTGLRGSKNRGERDSPLLPFIGTAPWYPHSVQSKGYRTISPVMKQQGREPDHWPPSNTVTRLWGVHRGEKFVLLFSFFSLRRVPCYGTVIDAILAKFETSFLAKFFLVSEVFN